EVEAGVDDEGNRSLAVEPLSQRVQQRRLPGADPTREDAEALAFARRVHQLGKRLAVGRAHINEARIRGGVERLFLEPVEGQVHAGPQDPPRPRTPTRRSFPWAAKYAVATIPISAMKIAHTARRMCHRRRRILPRVTNKGKLKTTGTGEKARKSSKARNDEWTDSATINIVHQIPRK